MLKMMNRAKKNNHQSSQRSKDAKAARNGVGAGANVGPAKPSLAQMGPQPAASVPGQLTAPSASVSGGGRTKKVKQTSANKTAAASVGGTARRARATAKETMPSKANESTRSESNADNSVGGLASVSEQPVGPKMERSNSFFLTRKLSSLYSKLSGSRENVSTTNAVSPVTEALPFQFVRSRSMSSIQLKRAYRRSQNESTLQNLHEDAILERSESTEETAAVAGPEVATAVPEVTPPPIPRFERSNSILASIRRKISFRSDRRSSNVSNWSASLQNLRQEDFMISYDDLSFIDYDQFNSYETNILKRRSSRVLEPGTKGSFMEDISSLTNCAKSVPTSEHLETVPVTEATNGGVVRRRRKNDTLLRTTLIRKSMDVEGNLDRDKNVYRNSLDADKLMCISNVNRKSFRWSADVERDVVALDLESADFADAKPLAKLVTGRQTPPPPYDVCDSGMIDGSESVKLSAICDSAGNTRSSVGYVSRSESLKRCRSYGGEGGFAFEEGFGRPAKQIEMKSLSLTHLDEIERQATTPTIITNDPHVRKVSSSEYFSVCFESDQNDPGVLIPATKGVRLAECLRASLSRRSLSFSQIYVTDNGFNNPHETGLRYTEPLDANMDISALAGRTLIVSERDGAPNRRTGGHLTLQKAASVGNQPSIMSSNSKLFTSTSTDDNYDQSPKASSASGKQSKQKWTIPFGSKGPQKSKLCELLDSYNKEIPKSTSSSSNFNNPEYVDALVGLRNLPQCWTDIVNCAGMSEAETKIQSAIWELVTTEVYYILALQTVTDLFLACLEDIQSQNILTDVDQNKLFSNIRDIWEANLRFWTLYLHPMVKHSQRTKDPMSIYYFQRGFVDFATIFTPYTKYCAEQSTCQFYCKEMYHNNALFMTYCAWCESQKMCNRLRLADILVRPMQRLTKYGLLLAAIKKHINDEAEGEAIDAMIHSVEEFVAGVNSHLTTRQESERLKGINARIDCYEVVDSNNETLDRLVKQHSIMFDLCQPMRGIDHGRKVFVEGDLKYKDGTGKMDVHCFLFTDFLLVCKKNKNDKLKIVRQPYMTDRLMVQLKDQAIYCCYVNELNMVVAAFTLQSAKAQHWYDSITKVKHIYNRMKQGTFGDVRQYGNIINISNSCNNSTSNSNMNINNDNISIKKSPLNSSIGSRVSSLNNSHSGSVDLNESKQVSIDFEKTNSLSSDEGAGVVNAVTGSGLVMMHSKYGAVSSRKPKNTVCTMQTKSSNSLTVQPYSGLGQSMPNLNLNSIQNSNTLSVPGTSNSQSHSGMVLLSPSQRGISYPPPSPTRATLRRGFAFSTSIKNPPLIKTRNVSSQQSFALSQQQSFNSASLAQHQQCLPSPSNTLHGAPNNSGTNSAIEGCAVASGLTLSSANVSFFKRKNSFQSVPNNSATSSVDQSLPNET
ncbi:pleckstrin homology domain-containing family G member 5 isoform X3 [Anopheles gambiae]|uniref:pleckstrin homology domain-containing family G member 5 isoform X3 n=1 Tax=Anopheles coluzzii TaxID=1518534 RepID=UPI0020FFD99F|nr:pleckstrin homology domain-containing family G member 5 isoform X3 [Anopheles coluzzii]XP_061511375.1 pleckstrin homology domain-containing family G member 5 isoform X3 [Anopheles gambiae]